MFEIDRRKGILILETTKDHRSLLIIINKPLNKIKIGKRKVILINL